MKRFLTMLILCITIFSVNVMALPNININGSIVEDNAVIVDGRTLVGVRGVFEKLGYDVYWDSDTSTATLKNDENTVVISSGKTTFTVNGSTITPDVPQQIISSRFYLPLRAIAEAVGAYVNWDKSTETVIIKTDTEVINLSKAQPGVRTIKNLLLTALEPVGSTMYIYGGGWNEEDTGAGWEARSIGLSPAWSEFAAKQNSSYDYSDYNYKKDVSVIHLGLDCSGYVGWVVYNTLYTESGLDGLVASSKKMADNFASYGWGTVSEKGTFNDYRAGDVMSAACSDCAHVWICVGQCDDGSVVFLHSSPQGVMLSGTYSPSGSKSSDAVKLASSYMQKYYPSWYSRYPDSSRNTSYLSHYKRFRWNIGIELADPEGLADMSAEEVLEELFGYL